jgi:rsbT co-antagonist protein RsbR
MEQEKKSVAQIMVFKQQEILAMWLKRLRSLLQSSTLKIMGERQLMIQAEKLLRHLTDSFASENYDDIERPEFNKSIDLLRDISASNAKQGVSPIETAIFVLSLKDPLLESLQEILGNDPTLFKSEVVKMNHVIDKLGILTFDAFTKAREELINQQNQTILELSTPTVKLWDKILLLPLIGVVDTMRAAQVIESLLETIFETESHVAILDVTGVPIIDTQVAQHLMKTITAASMLGAKVIVTGISPDMAQTMVKLDIELGAVRTCSTLRAGVSEGFKLIGKKIVNM